MKQIITISLLISLVFIACKVDPDHHVQFENLTDRSLTLVLNDSIFFNDIEPLSKTAYVSIPEGRNTIGGDLQGVFIAEGSGTVKWTVQCFDTTFVLKKK